MILDDFTYKSIESTASSGHRSEALAGICSRQIAGERGLCLRPIQLWTETVRILADTEYPLTFLWHFGRGTERCAHGGLQPNGINVGSFRFLDVSVVSGGEMVRDLPQRSRCLARAKKQSLVGKSGAGVLKNAPVAGVSSTSRDHVQQNQWWFFVPVLETIDNRLKQ